MHQRCLVIALLGIFLVSCTPPPSPKPGDERGVNVTPKGIRITPDVVYGHKFGMALTFDMYQPPKQNGAAVIFINSGGWRSHFPNFYEQTAEGLRLVAQEELEHMTTNLRSSNIEPLLAKGITVFAVRHGSRPKFGMSEIVADLRRAVRFVRFNAGKYGIDAERLGLWGRSAGGHLSLLLGTTADITNPDATEEFERGTGRVAAVVAYYPPTDLKRWINSLLKVLPDTPELALEEEQYGEFSPIYFVSSDDPPTLIIQGDQDPGVPIVEGESMHQALLKAGVKSKYVTIPGAGHGFEGKDADRALEESVSWFEEHLGVK